MRIIIEQHFFTSSKPEFTTVGITSGISAQEKIILEQNSLYFLPGELLYDKTDYQLPVKYVYYRFNNKYVLGTASYCGLDSLGRPGNYFFHNMVISEENFYEYKFNPIILINYFLEHSFFRKSLPDKIETLELDNNMLSAPPSPALDQDTVRLIVNTLTSYSFHHLPVLLRGNQEEILAFFNILFTISSYEQRKQLYFDSYTYGVSNEFPLLGLPSDSLYQQSRNTSLEIDLITGDKMKSKAIKSNPMNETSQKYNVPINMLFMGNPKPLEIVFELEHRFYNNINSFKETLNVITLEEKTIFFEIFRVPILDHILSKQDLKLFLSFSSCYRSLDFKKLFTNTQFRECLIRENDIGLLNLFLGWVLTQKEGEYFLLILKHKKLLENVINKNVNSVIKRYFFNICRKSILNYIIKNNSIETCLFFLDYYTNEDFSFFFRHQIFRDRIVEIKNIVLIDKLIKWIFEKKQKDHLGLIIRNDFLFNTYLTADKTILMEHKVSKPVSMRFLILFTNLKKNYSAEREENFYDFIFEFPSVFFNKPGFIQRINKYIKKLAKTDIKNIQFVRYFLHSAKDSKIKQELCAWDFYKLKTHQLEIVQDFFAAIIIRKTKFKHIPGYLSQIVNSISKKSEFIEFLIQRIRILETYILKNPISFRNYLLPWDYIFFKKKLLNQILLRFNVNLYAKRLNAIKNLLFQFSTEEKNLGD